jgi:hypothetical protein
MPASSYHAPEHHAMNKHIANNEIITINGTLSFSLDDYLKNNLGFISGTLTTFEKDGDSYSVYDWLGEGGEREDDPAITHKRAWNHYHDPLRWWEEAGYFTAQSPITWAQDIYQEYRFWSDKKNYSWQNVRGYYHIALTGRNFIGWVIAGNKTKRDEYFADTFRGVGQLMHLIQDASVPSHGRNDGHLAYHYETEAKNIHENELVVFNGFLSTPVGFNKSILGILNSTVPVPPIASIVDVDEYNGTNPSVTVSSPVGLAEYANANFFSRDTVFSDYSYPDLSGTIIDERDIDDPRNESQQIKRNYYVRTDPAYGETGYRLSTVGMLDRYLTGQNSDPGYFLDKYVFKDYAGLLIPRAVGYSAGLLDYFFRGEMDLVPVEGTQNQYMIMNFTENEEMYGDFYIYYDNINNERIQLAHWTKDQIGIILSGAYATVTFNKPPNAREEGEYILVFKGRLGNEQNAVVGKVIQSNETWIMDDLSSGTIPDSFSVKDIAVDPTGVYAVGFHTNHWVGSESWHVMKMDIDTSSVIWHEANDHYYFRDLAGGDSDTYNIPHLVIAHPASNGVYIAGNDQNNSYWNLQKRSPDTGALEWTNREWWHEHVNGMAADGSGIFSVGSGKYNSWRWDGTTWAAKKNDFDGNELWTDNNGATEGGSWDVVYEVASSQSGDFYISGWGDDSTSGLWAWRMEKRGADNELLYKEFSDFAGYATQVAVSSSGVYYAGQNEDTGVWTVQKRDLSDISLIWTQGISDIVNITEIAADDTGFYIAGATDFPLRGVIQKRDPDGNLIWKIYDVRNPIADAAGLYVVTGSNEVLKLDPVDGSDPDGDGYINFYDNCTYVSNYYQYDNDNDKVGNVCDNCFNTYNPDQADTDGDGVGNACE